MATYRELLAQREALEQQIAQAMKAEKAEAVARVRALVAEFGLSAPECGFAGGTARAGKGSGAGKRAVAAKYVGPSGEHWSGRGRVPKWLAALEAQGRSRSEFLVG